MPNSRSNSSAPGAPGHRIACVHRADRGRPLAPSVLVRHPDWHWTGRAGSPGPAKLHKNGFWSPSKNAVRKEGTPHHFNLSLSEMRQYSDSTMVLVLAEDSSPAEEADYPIDIDLDTSALLEEDDDGTLAAYAEAAHSLMRPARHAQRAQEGEGAAARGPRRALFYDDVPQQQFADMTIQPRHGHGSECGHGGDYSSATPDGSFSQNGVGPGPTHFPDGRQEREEAQLRRDAASQNGAALDEWARDSAANGHSGAHHDGEAWDRVQGASRDRDDAGAGLSDRYAYEDDGHPPRPEVTDMRDVHHHGSPSPSRNGASPGRNGASPERSNGRAPPPEGDAAEPAEAPPSPEAPTDPATIDWRAEVEAAHALGDAIRAAVSADRGEESDWALQDKQAALKRAEAEKEIGRFAPGEVAPASGEEDAMGSRDGGELKTSHSHAAVSFERAISHSRTRLAQPRRSGDYATRRQGHTPASPSARRSSRRDAHMQARVARMDLSNLSVYSLPTLRRLAKDMSLTGFEGLSKPQLVVRLMMEILVAAKAGGRNEEVDAWAVQRTSSAVEARRTRRPRARDLRREVMFRFDDDGSSSDREELGRVPRPERVVEKLPAELRREFNDMLAAATKRRERKRDDAAPAPAVVDFEPREDTSKAAWRAYHSEEPAGRGGDAGSNGASARHDGGYERGRSGNGASAYGGHNGNDAAAYGEAERCTELEHFSNGASTSGEPRRGSNGARADVGSGHDGGGFFDAASYVSSNGASAHDTGRDTYGSREAGSGAKYSTADESHRGGGQLSNGAGFFDAPQHHHSGNGASHEHADSSYSTNGAGFFDAARGDHIRNGASAGSERAYSRNGAAASSSGAGFFDSGQSHHSHNGASARGERAHSGNGAASANGAGLDDGTGFRESAPGHHSQNGASASHAHAHSSSGASFFDSARGHLQNGASAAAEVGRERMHSGHDPSFFEEDARDTAHGGGRALQEAVRHSGHGGGGFDGAHAPKADRREDSQGASRSREVHAHSEHGSGRRTSGGGGGGSHDASPTHKGRGDAAAQRQGAKRDAAAPVAVRSVDIDEDFESLAGLGMEQLQELCEELGIAQWAAMRKADMISAILAEAYGIGASP